MCRPNFTLFPTVFCIVGPCFQMGGSQSPCATCNSSNAALNLYRCCSTVLAASTTQNFLAPLTGLWHQFLKNAHLGANWENTLAFPSQKILFKFWRKLGGSWRTTEGLCHLLTELFKEQKERQSTEALQSYFPKDGLQQTSTAPHGHKLSG